MGCDIVSWGDSSLAGGLYFFRQPRPGFPLSGKSGNVREFCFDWNVRELLGNFAVCQGIMLLLMKH